jgi:AcrR family transcriptional regulator
MEDDKTFQKLRENERELRKQMILDSALNLFEKKSFYKTSMGDIAREVGVSASTLYSYFPSQEELFLEAFIRDLSYIDTMMKNVQRANAATDTDQEAMETLADMILSHLMNSEATFQMISLLITEVAMPEHILKKFNHFRNEFHEIIITVLKISGVKNPDLTTSRAFIASVLGAIMLFKNNPEHDAEQPEVTVRDLVRYIVNVFKAGIPVLEKMKQST